MSSLASDFKASNEFLIVNEIATCISSLLTDAIYDRIEFSNSIMPDEARKFGEKNVCYKLEQWKKTGSFDILNNISDYVA